MPFFDFEEVLTYEDSHDDMLKELQAMWNLAEKNNIKYKKDYAQQYDKKFKVADRELEVGDNIMIEHEGKKGANPKLQPIFLGPYEVVELRPQGVAYQLFRWRDVASFIAFVLVRAWKEENIVKMTCSLQ